MSSHKYFKLLLVSFVLFAYYTNITHFEHLFGKNDQCQICSLEKQNKSATPKLLFLDERTSLSATEITQPRRVEKRDSVLAKFTLEFTLSPLAREYSVEALPLGYFSHAPPIIRYS